MTTYFNWADYANEIIAGFDVTPKTRKPYKPLAKRGKYFKRKKPTN